MQINSTTNVHNKNLGFQGVKINPDLAEFGSGFAKEVQKAKVKLEKRYKDKVDIVIKLGLKPFEDDYGTTYTHTPKIIVTTSKTLYQKGKTQKALPQSLLDKFFGRSIKFKEVDEIKSRSLNGADHSFISPKMTSEAKL